MTIVASKVIVSQSLVGAVCVSVVGNESGRVPDRLDVEDDVVEDEEFVPEPLAVEDTGSYLLDQWDPRAGVGNHWNPTEEFLLLEHIAWIGMSTFGLVDCL